MKRKVSSYEKGKRIEYMVKKKLWLQGFNVLRVAGSKGLYDLVAWNEEQILFIQVKGTRLRKEEKRLITQDLVPESVIKQVWIKKGGDFVIEVL